MQTLITSLGSAASGVLILLIGRWTTLAEKRREDKKAARAAMRRDYEALLAALAKFRAERTAHLKVRFGWRARANVAIRATYESVAAFGWDAENRALARFLALAPAVRQITDWRQRVDEQEMAILGPMNEVIRAALPLASSDHERVAAATDKVLSLLGDDDDASMNKALAELRHAILDVAAAPQKRRRIRFWRRQRALDASAADPSAVAPRKS